MLLEECDPPPMPQLAPSDITDHVGRGCPGRAQLSHGAHVQVGSGSSDAGEPILLLRFFEVAGLLELGQAANMSFVAFVTAALD